MEPSLVLRYSDEVCSPNRQQTFDIVLIVKTAPQNIAIRDLFRAHVKAQRDHKRVGLAFLMGQSKTVQLESNDDIVAANFIDSYANLTSKTVAGLRWASTFCQNATSFFMFMDDDHRVNLNLLLKEVDFLSTSTKPVYGGFVWRNSWVHRRGKWAVSRKDIPFPKYPDFAAGPGYILDKRTLTRMAIASAFTRKTFSEDIYIGLLAVRLRDVKPRRINGIMNHVSCGFSSKIPEVPDCMVGYTKKLQKH